MSKKILTKYPHLLLTLMLLLSNVGVQRVLAQDCIVACHTNLNFPLPENSDNCTVEVRPEILINTTSEECDAAQIEVRLKFQDGTLIPNSPFVDDTYIGQTLIYEIIYLPNPDQGSCWGNLTIFDEKAPTVINCKDVDVYCFQDTRPIAEGGDVPEPNFSDCSAVTRTYEDELVRSDCGNNTLESINRTWTLTDAYGNTSICEQTITITRISLEEDAAFPLQCPASVTYTCDEQSPPNLDPSATGYPHFIIDGIRYDLIPNESNICGLGATFRDETFPLCGGSQKILRTWLIWDNCTDGSENDPIRCHQNIVIADETPPQISCTASLLVYTSNAQCEATFALPIATVTDECSPIASVTISTAFGTYEGNNGQLASLPIGEHQITYEAADQCGNVSSCETTIIVQDQTPPIAVCQENTAVGLTIDGGAVIFAETFDRGSFDNCAVDTFLVRRMASSCLPASSFDAFVSFGCCEVGETVMVQFRVFDESGNFNDCMIAVEVQDKLPPQLTCPPDKTVNCTADLSDLSVFGGIGVLDNCDNYAVEESALYQINSCGTGKIVRTFTVTDRSGYEGTCTQTIFVENDNPFSEDFISWPADYYTNSCGQDIAPESLPVLPENYGFPIFRGAACDNVAATFEDRVLEGDFPACYKILRRWTVVDWCQFNPNQGNVGRWTHEQIIKVEDLEMPLLTCPDDVVAGNNTGNCGSTFVDILPVVATDCSDDLAYSHQIDYDNDGQNLRYFIGGNASGEYPIGTHRVIFRVADGCGNVSSCESLVTVRDTKPPTAICNNGISVDLMEMSGGTGVIEVDPRMIDASSSDNCTPRSALQFSLSPSRFTCENLGVNTVVFTVTDASGNTASCTTQIVIQDNDNGCPQNGMAALAGYVHNEMGERVENVRISVNGNQSNSQMTDVSGAFRFDNLPLGGDYTIAPRKTTHADNGVTTFDLVLMTKHVLGLQLFDSPYKLIAADINRNGKVTTFDIVQLRKLILGIIDDFPSNDSWRFVDASHVFTNPADPFIDQIPEVRSYNNVVESDMTADFVAVKIGDVNNSALMDATSTTVEERSLGRSTFWTDDQMIRAGEQVAVTLHASGQELLQGYQLAFKYDEDVLSWMSLGADEQTNIGAEHFNFARASEGVITTSWHQATTAVHELASPNKVLFTLIFQAKADAQLSEILMLDNTILRAESYWGKTAVPTPATVDLQFRIADSSPPVVLYQNQPNPFDQQTDITFYLPEAMAVNLSIFDLNGRLLWSKQAAGVAGLQQMKVNASTLEQRGVLYYRLSTQMGAVTKKMIVY